MFSARPVFSSRRAAVAAGAVCVPLAAALIGFGVVQRVRPLALATFWGLLLLGAFIGWGAFFNRVAYGAERLGWSMRATFGMAMAVAYGGVLCVLSLASRGMLFGFVAIGLLLYAWSTADDVLGAYDSKLWTRWRTISPAYAIGVLALMTLLGFQYVGGIAEYRLNLGDDLLAYASYPRRILETGTLIDPFSARRMSTYGGQQFLQTFTMLAGAERNLNQFDAGLCVIVMCGLVFQELKKVRQRLGWLVLLVVLFVLMLPGRRFNLGGWMSGAVFLFAAFRLMRWEAFASTRRNANAVAMALLMSALCTLRNSYLTMAAVLVLANYVVLAFTVDRTRARLLPMLREMMMCGVVTVALLVPWAILAYRSNHSLLWPLMKGYSNPQYLLFARSFPEYTGLVRAKAVWANLMHHEPIRTLPLFLLPAIFLADRSERKALRVTLVMALVGFFAVVWNFPGSDPFSNERYTFAALLPAVLATLVAALELLGGALRPRTASQLAAAGLALIALVLQIHESKASTEKTYETHLERIWEASRDKRQPWRDYAYQEMQERVPAGEPLLAMVDDPHWFDYRRNNIILLDLPGAASLPPGWPLLGSRQQTTDYFLKLGFRYLAMVKPSASKESYRRSHWERNARGMPWKLIIQYYRAMFDYVEEISKERKVLFDNGVMVLVDLARPFEPDEPEGFPLRHRRFEGMPGEPGDGEPGDGVERNEPAPELQPPAPPATPAVRPERRAPADDDGASDRRRRRVGPAFEPPRRAAPATRERRAREE